MAKYKHKYSCVLIVTLSALASFQQAFASETISEISCSGKPVTTGKTRLSSIKLYDKDGKRIDSFSYKGSVDIYATTTDGKIVIKKPEKNWPAVTDDKTCVLTDKMSIKAADYQCRENPEANGQYAAPSLAYPEVSNRQIAGSQGSGLAIRACDK